MTLFTYVLSNPIGLILVSLIILGFIFYLPHLFLLCIIAVSVGFVFENIIRDKIQHMTTGEERIIVAGFLSAIAGFVVGRVV
jgi:hypothetical protein